MAKGSEVLTMLKPEGGWIISGDSYEDITWIDCEPITREIFEAGFAKVDGWKAQKEAEAQAKRQELLDRLGITAEELRLLFG